VPLWALAHRLLCQRVLRCADYSSYHLWLHWVVTCNELKRLLASQGCVFSEGRRHTFVRLGTRTTLLPHGKKEIKTGTLRSVLNALGLTLVKLQRER
jgi:predicted RNA binding protein YcfA (HicA-like mRNA interferase family)